MVDQSAIGRSSRSNPATYLGFFDTIRKLFAEETGQPAALFSFNSKGACPTCKGQGTISIEMNFLDDGLSLTAREALDVFEHKAIHGLHMADIERLMAILNRLVDDGNSVVVIEHNLDVIAQADWVIDLGPEGGNAGGRLVAAGTPEMIAGEQGSHTGRFLSERFQAV